VFQRHTLNAALTISLALTGALSAAPTNDSCGDLPSHSELKAALQQAVAAESSGLNFHMWATIVDRDGNVCAVAFSGTSRSAQWLGSRVISAQKANTANAFSLDRTAASNGSGPAAGLSLSTANLYSAVQPGGSLFGLQLSNPVDTANAYKGPTSNFGTSNDPMKGERVGGVNVFGGGLALYDANHSVVGGVGVSGDTSCADHNIAWRVRNILVLDHMAQNGSLAAVPGPASLFAGDATHPDNIIFDITANPAGGTGNSASGFGHPTCLNTSGSNTLPAVRP